jgi:hypothetical protein
MVSPLKIRSAAFGIRRPSFQGQDVAADPTEPKPIFDIGFNSGIESPFRLGSRSSQHCRHSVIHTDREIALADGASIFIYNGDSTA